MTGLGLIEMTKKGKRGLESLVYVIVPIVKVPAEFFAGIGGKDIEKNSEYLTMTIANAILVEVHPSVAEVLQSEEGNENLERIQNSFNKKVVIKPSLEVT